MSRSFLLCGFALVIAVGFLFHTSLFAGFTCNNSGFCDTSRDTDCTGYCGVPCGDYEKIHNNNVHKIATSPGTCSYYTFLTIDCGVSTKCILHTIMDRKCLYEPTNGNSFCRSSSGNVCDECEAYSAVVNFTAESHVCHDCNP